MPPLGTLPGAPSGSERRGRSVEEGLETIRATQGENELSRRRRRYVLVDYEVDSRWWLRKQL